MAIIAELENLPRGIYTGAIGYMGPGRQALFNVAIRTALVDKQTHEAVYGVGGGIAWDSDPDDEYQECLTKARILTGRNFVAFQLLETLLWVPEDGFFLLDRHLDRMAASADYFDFKFDRSRILKALEELADRLPEQRHRIRLLTQRDGQVQLTGAPILVSSKARSRQIVLAYEPVDTAYPFIYHKTTRRGVYDRALQAANDGDDVLLWYEDGDITETSIANVIVRIAGERVTPPVECGLLAGTYRELLLQKGDIRERKIPVSELSQATELTLINSVRGEYSASLFWPGEHPSQASQPENDI